MATWSWTLPVRRRGEERRTSGPQCGAPKAVGCCKHLGQAATSPPARLGFAGVVSGALDVGGALIVGRPARAPRSSFATGCDAANRRAPDRAPRSNGNRTRCAWFRRAADLARVFGQPALKRYRISVGVSKVEAGGPGANRSASPVSPQSWSEQAWGPANAQFRAARGGGGLRAGAESFERFVVHLTTRHLPSPSASSTSPPAHVPSSATRPTRARAHPRQLPVPAPAMSPTPSGAQSTKPNSQCQFCEKVRRASVELPACGGSPVPVHSRSRSSSTANDTSELVSLAPLRSLVPAGALRQPLVDEESHLGA